jgi:hypothetical protein
MVLRRLYPRQIRYADTPAFQGETSLFRIQDMIYKDELSQARHELENLNWLDPGRTEERRVLQKKICLQIIVCRFVGEFDVAKSYLQTLNQNVLFQELNV